KTLKTVQDNVQKFRNYYQRRPGMTYFQQIDAAGAVVGFSRRFRSFLSNFVMGNTVPSTQPIGDRNRQYQVDRDFVNTPEERDRTSALDRPNDIDPVRQAGEAGYRLHGNLDKRVGVNHDTV